MQPATAATVLHFKCLLEDVDVLAVWADTVGLSVSSRERAACSHSAHCTRHTAHCNVTCAQDTLIT